MTDTKEAARAALSEALRDPRVGFAIKACMIGGAYDAFTGAIEQAIAGERERSARAQQNTGHLISLMNNRPADRHKLTYTNYRGETSERELHLVRIWFGSTEWHPGPHLLLKAFDYEKDAYRDFAVADFHFF